MSASDKEPAVSPTDGYHPNFATTTSRYPVTLQNGIGEPLKFKFSRLLLIESSSFFDNLFSLPLSQKSPLSSASGETAREPEEPIELPSATSDGLALVLKLLDYGYQSGDQLPWPDHETLSNFVTLVDALNLPYTVRVLLQYASPPLSSADCFERFAVAAAAAAEQDVKRAARSSLLCNIKDRSAWTLDLLQKSPTAHLILFETHLLWPELLEKFEIEFTSKLSQHLQTERAFHNSRSCTAFESLTPTLLSLLHEEWQARPDTRSMHERGQAIIAAAVAILKPSHCFDCSPQPGYVPCFSSAFEQVIKPFLGGR